VFTVEQRSSRLHTAPVNAFVEAGGKCFFLKNIEKLTSVTNENCPTVPYCGNEGVALYGLRSRDVKPQW